MSDKTCSVFTGRSQGDRCRKPGPCIRVTTRVAGVIKHIHYVCEDCRIEMKFPNHDIELEATPPPHSKLVSHREEEFTSA